MFLFTALLIVLLFISVFIVVSGVVGGAALILVFGDVIVFALLVAFFVKHLAKK